MTEIKRYEVGHISESDDGIDCCRRNPFGEIVAFKDHAAIVAVKDARISELETMFQKKVVEDGNKITALQEQVRALAAEVNYLRNEIKQHSTSVHFCEVCGKDDPCKTDDVCFSLNHPLPDTDAVIREIRAQAVELASRKLLDIGDKSYSGYELECLAKTIRSGEQQ